MFGLWEAVRRPQRKASAENMRDTKGETMTAQPNLFGWDDAAPVATMEREPIHDDRRTWKRRYVSPVKGEKHHAARLAHSKRLQAVMKVLSDGQWHTSMDISRAANVLNPSGAISELRHPKNDITIESEHMVQDNLTGRDIWRYRWPKAEGVAA